jgi:hypothetical protein
MGKFLFLALSLVFAGSINIAFGSSGMTLKEMRKDFVSHRLIVPLEEVGDVDMVFDVKIGGWDWMYRRYGQTIRDRGIKGKRPFWYVLRSLLTTFDQEKQENFTDLSGISINDSLTLSSYEDADILGMDSGRLISLHYYLACVGANKRATKAKHAWYELARANPTVTFPFWRERSGDGGEIVCEQICAPTFAQLLKNLEIPGKDGLNYFIPDVDPDYYFFSDDPVLKSKQVNKYGCILDP